MIYITNSFSLSMLDEWRLTDQTSETAISVIPVDPIDWLNEAESRHGPALSIVGHADTAALFAKQLGRDVAFNRQSVTVDESTELLIGQYKGPRLPEGTTELPDGAALQWVVVSLL